MNIRGWRELAVVVVAAIGAGCSPVAREPMTAEKLEAHREEQLADIRRYMFSARDRIVERMAEEARQEVRTGRRATFDVLIISGGGDYGAFGAGVLQGWGRVAAEQACRPEFDLVTGVSTGALIAPFAFVGESDDYGRILRLYTEPKDDWFALRGLLFFLPSNSSLTDNTGLRRDVQKELDASMIERIAAMGERNRLLLVGTTDLDLGVLHPWDLTVEAQKVAAGGSSERFYDVIMASTAIPAVFPPVIIDGSLYVDGGTTANILYDSDLRNDEAPVATFRRLHPELPLPRTRFWVVVNNQMGGTPRQVEQSWLAVTRVSVETAVRSSTIGALKQLSLQCELQRRDGVDVQFRYIAIPDEWKPLSSDPFDKATMTSLADLGMRMGADPASWQSDMVGKPSSKPEARLGQER